MTGRGLHIFAVQLVVTDAIPGCGKGFPFHAVAACLARVGRPQSTLPFAQQADLAKPGQTQLTGIRRKRRLTEAAASAAPYQNAMRVMQKKAVRMLGLALMLGFAPLAWPSDLPASFSRTWCAYQTERFRFLTDLPHRRAAARIKRLVRFRQLFLELFPNAQGRAGLPLRMLVLRRAKDLGELAGNTAYAGITVPSLRFYQLLIGPDPSPAFSDTGMHEYAHYLMRNQTTWNYPLWYEEGLATYLGAVRLHGSAPTLARLGGKPWADAQWRLATRGEKEMDYEEVVGAANLLDWPLSKQTDFYQKSWLMVHFIRLGHLLDHPDLRGRLADYLAHTRRDFSAAFRLSPTALGELLRSYWRRRSLPNETVPLPEAEAPRVARRCLSSAESRLELAQSIADLNPRLAVAALNSLDGPASAKRLTALSIALTNLDGRRAATAVEQALRLAPNHPGATVQRARLQVRGCALSSAPACMANWAQAAELYRRAWKDSPERYDAAYGLGVAYLHTRGAKEALRYLRLAQERMPSVAQTNYYLGEAYRRLGDERAAEHLHKALSWSLEPAWKARAETALARLRGRY